jgi:hypothetical protein
LKLWNDMIFVMCPSTGGSSEVNAEAQYQGDADLPCGTRNAGLSRINRRAQAAAISVAIECVTSARYGWK